MTLDGHIHYEIIKITETNIIARQDRYRAHFTDLSGPQCPHPINHDILFYGGLLHQQYFVDMCVKTEE